MTRSTNILVLLAVSLEQGKPKTEKSLAAVNEFMAT